eukprot:CAMPEP_0181026220 /NCGR_PEP_ID=MMETSP1070-20121207/3520_1 /TAXON_ID=265543 /ORGANISM="Minutocellus polymorphus, Strain NH13" /LENGTH=768 /DNA_ID=CAMNT_0023103391 /DNA_START=264 /DNA_END=2567 /DNA_ORIENTATION=+
MASDAEKDLEAGGTEDAKPNDYKRSSFGSLSSGRSASLDLSSHPTDKDALLASRARANSMSMSSRNLGGLGNGKKVAVAQQLQSSRNLLGGVQEHTSGGAVTEHRLTSAVSKLGIIETGLESMSQRVSSQGRGRNRRGADDDDLSSLGGETMTGRSALTGATSDQDGASCASAPSWSGRGKQKEKVLLHPMKVDLPNGSLTAILGPSGSGKTTLLKFLSGSLDNSIKFRGGANLPGTRSYLAEQTYLHGFYTAQSYLKHYDRLTTGLAKGGKSHKEMDGILKSLGILEDRQNVAVGDLFRRGLSEGERRRLDLATMVLGAPDTLFCEEPTGNLDSETSSSVMEFLKGYSSQPGRRVIVTINKPSSMVWNLIDNVILVAQGRIIYEGPRFDMEAFFAYNQSPTPKRFSQVEHYLSVVSSLGKKKKNARSVEEWAKSFKKWQEEADEDEGDMLGDDIETCFPTAITTVQISRGAVQKSKYLKKIWVMLELIRRYFLDLFLNPGMLWVRFAMYFMLSLMIGLLFFGLGDKTSYTSIQSRASVLFYSVSFYIFMVVAVLPFRVHDKAVAAKEVFNSYYHPLAHHFASTLASLFGVLILAFITTVIMVPMAKFHAPFKFFLDMLLSLNCAEALAQMVTLLVSNYIIGIVGLAGLFGFFMLLMGFMLVPSEFPIWLRWAYHVPFHTYTWRSFMYIEFSGPENVFDSDEFPTGMDVLRAYEIDNVNYGHDMLVLVGYGIIIHLISASIILVRQWKANRIEEEMVADEEAKDDIGA